MYRICLKLKPYMQIVACDTALNVDHHDHGKIKILTFGLDRNYKKKKSN